MTINSARIAILLLLIISLACVTACKDEKSAVDAPKDPARCVLLDLGEVTDFMSSDKPIPDDQLVSMTGIADPKMLVWQDATTKRVHYVTKIMGAGGKLLYTEQVPAGEKPRILANFKGTIRLWKNIPGKDALDMAKALKKEWGTTIDPNDTYLLTGGVKPEGCK
jgi:hypothetical protein